MEDVCPQCREEFGVFKWRHQCRQCKRDFCDDCSNYRYDVVVPAESELTRLCPACIVLVAAQYQDKKNLTGLPTSAFKAFGVTYQCSAIASCTEKAMFVDVALGFGKANPRYRAAYSSHPATRQFSSARSHPGSSPFSHPQQPNQNSNQQQYYHWHNPYHHHQQQQQPQQRQPPQSYPFSQQQPHRQFSAHSHPDSNPFSHHQQPNYNSNQQQQSHQRGNSAPANAPNQSPFAHSNAGFQQQQQQQQKQQRHQHVNLGTVRPARPPPKMTVDETYGVLSVKQLREILDKYGVDHDDCFDKSDLVERVKRAKADDADGEIPDEECCIVCMDARIATVFLECGHMAACRICARAVMAKSPTCPLCRTPITRVVDVHHAKR